VSSDVLGNPASCLFDAGLTMALGIGESQTLIKANGWYDNEWGYANRLVDLVLLVAKKP
jgi:glyceraldehyde 3-phosphate dehydrogenase